MQPRMCNFDGEKCAFCPSSRYEGNLQTFAMAPAANRIAGCGRASRQVYAPKNGRLTAAEVQTKMADAPGLD